MKYYTAFFILMLWFMTGHTCAISPFYQIVTNPQRYIEKSNAVFTAKLINIDQPNHTFQIAEFEVLEIFKGNLKATITIINNIENNCSRLFYTPGSIYYVFGNIVNQNNEIIMDGFPGFVHEDYANKMKLPLKLDDKLNDIE